MIAALRTIHGSFSWLVGSMHGADSIRLQPPSIVFGLLFSWRHYPKLWLYIVWNDYLEQEEKATLQPQYRIGAIKAE